MFFLTLRFVCLRPVLPFAISQHPIAWPKMNPHTKAPSIAVSHHQTVT
jgi:hypothetical protein